MAVNAAARAVLVSDCMTGSDDVFGEGEDASIDIMCDHIITTTLYMIHTMYPETALLVCLTESHMICACEQTKSFGRNQLLL
jgi:hypothetical protein